MNCIVGSNNYVYDEEGRLIKDVAEEISNIVWRVDGKVKEINRPSTSTKKKLKFDYENMPWQMKEECFSGKKKGTGEMGNRIAKHVFDNQTGLLERSTYYILDAQGNQLTTYEHVVDNSTANFVLKERHIFGSSRLGMLNEDVNVLTTQIGQNVQHEVGKKYYELSNHLGNVLSVFTDLKIPQSSNTVTVSSYRVFIAGTTDYSPFGVELDGRTQSPEAYRYSFNGMEKDNEVKGEGNSYDFGARMLDPRVGRWLSTDPLAEKYPFLSLYNFVANSPIICLDPDGKVIIFANDASKEFFTSFKASADRATKKRIRKLEKSDIYYEIKLGFQADMRGVLLPDQPIDYSEQNAVTKFKSEVDGKVTFQLIVDNSLPINEEFAAMAEEISHAEDFENGEVGVISAGYGGWFVGLDIFKEIKSKDASLDYMKHAKEQNSEIQLTEINVEWEKLGSDDELKKQALTGGNSEVFGDYSNLSLQKEKIETDETVLKTDLDDFNKNYGIKNTSYIFKEKGQTKIIDSTIKN